jgi:Nitroreductase
MADNYLEKKYEALHSGSPKPARRAGNSIDTLLLRNRSHRGYHKDYIVMQRQLEAIVSVNTKIPSARNQQVLRFKCVTRENGAEKVLRNIKLGGALPELHLPLAGTEPEAFIIVCSSIEETKYVDIDLGISLQSMLLKAVDLGLNGIIICAFNKAEIIKEFDLKYEPLAILAIGKGAEKIELTPISETENHNYYRKDGTHFVPKVKIDELLL